MAETENFRLPALDTPATALSGTTLRQATFEGNTVVPTRDLEALVSPHLGKTLTDAEIEALRQELTRHYIRLGYINSGVLLLGGGAQDGVLRFKIVEGRIGEVRIRGLDALHPAYLSDRLARENEVFNLNSLQERMQVLLGDPLFGRLNARVVPGAALGSATLDVDAVEARRYQLTAFVNNYQPPSTGKYLAGVQGELRNLSGRGDTLNATLQGSNGQTGYNLGWQLPLSARGTQLQLGAFRLNAAVVEEPLDKLDISSKSSGWEAGVSHPLMQTSTQRLALGVVYAERESETTLSGLPFAFSPGAPDGRNKVKDWRLFQEYMLRRERRAYVLRSTFIQGKNNTPFLEGVANQPANQYLIWVGQAQALLPAFNQDVLMLRTNVQVTDRRLVSLNQLPLGGSGSVRGYRENQLVRDQGWVASIEYRHLLSFDTDSKLRLTLFPFVDYGVGWNAGQNKDTLRSFGLGLNATYLALDADLVLARRQNDPPVKSSGTLQDEGVHFQLRYRFF